MGPQGTAPNDKSLKSFISGAAPRNPMAPPLKTPGDKIWDQNFQVSVVFRPLWPKRAIPHPIAIQNMRFRRNIFLVEVPFIAIFWECTFSSFHLIHPPWLYIAPEAHFVLCFWMPATPSQEFLGRGSLDKSIGQARPGAAFSFGAGQSVQLRPKHSRYNRVFMHWRILD